jgi:sterol desaturase/sphingolipid hydroxylase (fatty acid hydroxylase superfamily)
MLENLWFVTKQVLGIFSSSIASSYLICLVCNSPFYNPKLSNSELLSTLIESSFNLGVIGIEVITTACLYYPYMDLEKHSIIRMLSNIIEYSFWIELFYYFYHRFLHTSNWYLLIHAKHHSNKVIYPINTLHIGILDSTGMIATLIAPLWFVNVNLFEYSFIIYVYLTGAFLTHSNLLVSRHVAHHQKFKCNFCFLFPIFDYALGTLQNPENN